ncbi:MAG TPA: SPFH domain-containing protein [Nevskia sp.]|jgi:regulator of protease activity HflC (stomatin/prohibitin superfamily)|nr:SPFH domain-containing protein [Nevskia sp.]
MSELDHVNGADGLGRRLWRARGAVLVLLVLGGAGYSLYRHPPLQAVQHGEVGLRSNRLFGGEVREFGEGSVLVLPGLQELRRYSLRDRVYRPVDSASASGAAPFQSIEGLSLGVDLAIRYALDPARVAASAGSLPEDIDGQVVQPAVQNAIYRIFARYTVREIFTSKRAEIQQVIESELKPRLAADGILLRGVQMGKVDLPPDYRAGMEKLLAEELENEKMQYTLQLKDQQVKQSALEAEAEKVRREKAAEAAANEQVIAARGQEEAMKHVLPFKQKQIEQRALEAEAEKQARIKTAEANAQARRIEAAGEADSRQKLADADGYRLERLGRIASAQMERDGELLSRHPLLIQKTMADKLSDKVSVIIAPPPASGGFIGSALLGQAAPLPVSAQPAASGEGE